MPLDFGWPLKKVWDGFVNPYRFPPCGACAYEAAPWAPGQPSTGLSPEAYAISATFYPHSISWNDRSRADLLAWHDKIGQKEVDNLLEKGRLQTWVPREPTEDNPRSGRWESLPLTAAEVNERQRGISFFGGHDTINKWILVKFRCEQLGITVECFACNGMGDIATEDERNTKDSWERTEPPSGAGYQLWETVTEGSPISPVFASQEELAVWMSEPARGGDQVTKDEAMRFIEAGWAPTLVGIPGQGVVSGVEAASKLSGEGEPQ